MKVTNMLHYQILVSTIHGKILNSYIKTANSKYQLQCCTKVKSANSPADTSQNSASQKPHQKLRNNEKLPDHTKT